MCISQARFVRSRQGGLTLVELIMFIVIVSVGIAGVLVAMNVTVQHSADPLITKQALAIAESLLEEIELQPYTICDPTDDNVTTATAANECASLAQGIGPSPSNASRFTQLNIPRFNNVGDYAGYSMNPVIDISGSPVAALSAYRADVSISNPAAAINGVPASEILKIDVRVRGPSNTDLTLTGYRFRYAPNSP
jgi:MSHA pilin protein MshD